MFTTLSSFCFMEINPSRRKRNVCANCSRLPLSPLHHLKVYYRGVVVKQTEVIHSKQRLYALDRWYTLERIYYSFLEK